MRPLILVEAGMLQRPFYQSTIAFLTLLALVGGAVLLVNDTRSPGVEIVPAPTRSAPTPAPGSTPTTGPAVAGLVNINTATARELDALPGIGEVLSERIVAYREQHGPFARTDQLMLVSGIGETTYDRLRELVTVGE